jgi:hypothetical protein
MKSVITAYKVCKGDGLTVTVCFSNTKGFTLFKDCVFFRFSNELKKDFKKRIQDYIKEQEDNLTQNTSFYDLVGQELIRGNFHGD